MAPSHGKSSCFLFLLSLLIQSDSVLYRVAATSGFHDEMPNPAFTYTLGVDYASDVEDEEASIQKVLESEIVVQEIATRNDTKLWFGHGDDSRTPPMSGCFLTRAFIGASTHPFSMDLRHFFETDGDHNDDDENDDDDDDDGDSSMLSNLSLRRSNTFMVERSATNIKTAKKTALLLRGGSTNILAKGLSSEMSKRLFVTALVTLLFEGSMGHILEFLKISLQTAQTETSYLRVMREITAEKGISGLWDGFVPWGVVQAVFKGAVFGLAHAAATKILVPAARDGMLPMSLALTLAGGIGGGFQGYVLSPTLLLKTRVMTNTLFREKMSLWKTTVLSFRVGYDVVKSEGLGTLMKGANVFATKRVFDWASRYFFANLFEDLFASVKGGSLSIGEKSIASLLGGVASTCLTLPLDVLVAKTQDAKKAGVKVSAISLFMDELREKGAKGLSDAYLRGFTARLLHVCLTTVVVKTGTPIVYEELFGKVSE